jgi:hypothetical protein
MAKSHVSIVRMRCGGMAIPPLDWIGQMTNPQTAVDGPAEQIDRPLPRSHGRSPSD